MKKTHYSYPGRLPDCTEITTVEINHALQTVLDKDIKEAIIFSDSKTAINNEGNTRSKKQRN